VKTWIVAGGSGGHLFPALALAEHLKAQGPCHLLTTAHPMDRVVRETNLTLQGDGKPRPAEGPGRWVTVDLKRFTPFWKWLGPSYLVHQARALLQIKALMKELKPDVVVGFGGYISAVAVSLARISGVPTIIHKQNVSPGRANRWLARIADTVAVSFKETREYLPLKEKVGVTGNPLRSHLVSSLAHPVGAAGSFHQNGCVAEEARPFFGLEERKPVLLVMGGSQGSEFINTLSLKMWQILPSDQREKVQVIHLAGIKEAGFLKRVYAQMGMVAKVFDFLQEMHLAYAAATLILSRAGATAIAEMVALQKPAILIPYPYAGGHQRANAHWMSSQGGAVVLEQAQLTPQRLWKEIDSLLQAPGRLAQMEAALRSVSNGSAAERLGVLVRRLAR